MRSDPQSQQFEQIIYTHRHGLPPEILPNIARDHRIIFHLPTCPRPGNADVACRCPCTIIYSGARPGIIGVRRYQRPVEALPKEPRPKMSPAKRQEMARRAWQPRRAREAQQRGTPCNA